MSLFKIIKDFLAEPRLKNINVDSDELITIHRRILMEKTMMKNVFLEFYNVCNEIDKKKFSGDGPRIEIGAGVSFFKQSFPDIVSTDIKNAPHLDKVLDALNMDLDDNSVRAIFGLNCFHHFPNPDSFFSELKRVLQPGGGVVLIEPYYGVVASRFFKQLFYTEHFNMDQKDWNTPDNTGSMNGANQALSYVVLKRDRELFETKHPELEITIEYPLNNYLRYLLSGGLNFKPLLPSMAEPLIKFAELILTPFNKIFALHHVMVIQKK